MSQLEDIETRRRAYMRGDTSQQTIFEIVEDGAHLLALVREQAAKLERVEKVADKWWANFPSKARAIRDALYPLEES